MDLQMPIMNGFEATKHPQYNEFTNDPLLQMLLLMLKNVNPLE
jgi:CheY-like chemotaxis protein